MNITIVKRPQEDPAMTRSRIIIALSAGLMSLSLAGAPAAFAQTTTKDNMGKTDSKSKDNMAKDNMGKTDGKKDTKKDNMSDGMKK
jgi:pentapeptide MXKDX repeat protein